MRMLQVAKKGVPPVCSANAAREGAHRAKQLFPGRAYALPGMARKAPDRTPAVAATSSPRGSIRPPAPRAELELDKA
jgi:hypothetical protein